MVTKDSSTIETIYDTIDSFDLLNLKSDLLKGIYGNNSLYYFIINSQEYGFEKPSIAQSRGILLILQRKDTIITADAQTGKTSTLAISLLQIIDSDISQCQAIIFESSREISNETRDLIKDLGNYLNVKVHTCTGGTKIMDDTTKLQEEGIQLIIGTPGRIQDLLMKGTIKTEYLKLVAFDDIDRILDTGFKEQIYEILKEKIGAANIVLTTSANSPEILDLVKKFMKNPVNVRAKYPELTLDGVKQYFVQVEKDECKFDTLLEILENIG